MSMNRIHNIGNPNQQLDKYKTVLCVCSAGLLRSPTAALVLSQEPFNFNTRSVGLESHALLMLDTVACMWADEIVVMEQWMADHILELSADFKNQITVLDIEDRYRYRDPELMQLIAKNYKEKSVNKES